jgi:hypothetical protein
MMATPEHPDLPRTHEDAPPRAAEPNLLRAIAARARRASDGALVACALAGLVAIGGLVWLEGRGWGVLLPLVALGAYGAWGVLDRALDERLALRRTGVPRTLADRTLVASRAVVAVLGVAIGAAAMLALLGMLLGRLIS